MQANVASAGGGGALRPKGEFGGVVDVGTRMISRVLSTNPLRTRGDLQAAALELWRPLTPFFERDGAGARLGENAASYGERAACVETFARPLWGVAALVAGGGRFPETDLLAGVLAEGVDPANPRYWGAIGDRDQRAVEMGSLAAALWLAPQLLWEPLSTKTRAHLVAWLRQINARELWDNNWLFFRVLVNGALRSVGEAPDEKRVQADVARLVSFGREGGWASDGPTPQFDYYIPMAMHFYGLLHAKLAGASAPGASEFVNGARTFAPDFAAWFARSGSALPIGRSLAYRFAQGAFWGALAFADVEALRWGTLKRLHLQHLRWWLRQPIFSETGLLTVGYRYPNQIMAEAYNAPGSPYWAMKAFLPLALPETHPFWTAEEQDAEVPAVVSSRARSGLLVCRDTERDHVFALTNNPPHPAAHRHTREKYGKFAYSTAFGFHTPVGGGSPRDGAGDSMLLLSDDGRDWRGREAFTDIAEEGQLHSRWTPWPDVVVDTWLAPALPGHVRVHRVRTARQLQTCEGGFPIETRAEPSARWTNAGRAAADNQQAHSAVFDLAGERRAELIAPEPNTNLLHPLATVPVLTASLLPGETWLFTAVVGLPGSGQSAAALKGRRELHVNQRGAPSVWQGDRQILRAAGAWSEKGAPPDVRLVRPANPPWRRLFSWLRSRAKLPPLG
ncbi:MAG TPA: DUF2264 domain-containing protein, partial [Opitutus sp.]|nr:DUF2264 domain-containing protein [Opitutus sp.]